ncbi:CCA tRNA nucleotidyltransferase [Sphingorhabdus sp. Alg239-R122]|uniref:CCA tRNA nucleotidyltransferase n=1 Tax=Sphingorhabdus sp. Alg239-R122 TaxID=2305989 RepID=UPI0013DB9068|nr:CCA tRNA nucleotidyltransferase [Sphingorhabdus sp. Alg239-R122]
MTDVQARIEAARWLRRDSLKQLVAALDPQRGLCRYVGGVVRDTLRGSAVNDIDMATILKPEEVMKRLKSHEIKVVPTGIDHGTVTAVLPDGHVEITTLRRDVSTDGRRATVAFSDDWREDAARRDFTINALYLDPHSHEVHDYFDGQDDLAKGMVRFIGSAEERICEDYLRILRFFRFTARFAKGEPDKTALEACANQAAGLKSLSRERIASEILALLSLENPAHATGMMFDINIWNEIIPETQAERQSQLFRLIAREQQHNVAPFAPSRLLCLLPEDARLVDKIASRLRFSNKMRKKISALLSRHDATQANARALAYRFGEEIAVQKLLLSADNNEIDPALDMLVGWERPEFHVSGRHIVAAGVPAGPDVSSALQEIEEQWIAEGFPPGDRQAEICDTVSQSYTT